MPFNSCIQYPMDKEKGLKIPVQLRINMWLGLSAQEKKFNTFSEGNFSVYAEMVQYLCKTFVSAYFRGHCINYGLNTLLLFPPSVV